VWPAWQGLVLGVASQLPGLRPAADFLEDKFGGRVCPMSLDQEGCDPFILLVHHRHAFRPLDFFRPLFSAVIMPEGFPAHPHRGFETVTYVLPKRGGLVHRDSEGCKMRYGDGAVQWMTAGRGMLHEEMWDVTNGNEFELYQLWVNLPPGDKFTPPGCQLLTPAGSPSAAVVEREGRLSGVRRAEIPVVEAQGGKVSLRLLAGEQDGVRGGAETFSPMLLAHVQIRGEGTAHSVAVPYGWNCFAYVRRGRVDVGGEQVAGTYEMVYFAAGGDCVRLAALSEEADVMLFAGEPIRAPVASSGTMVMNTEQQVAEAMRDYQRGAFGVPWDHALDDEQWAQHTAGRQ